jgi:hypothetical protein
MKSGNNGFFGSVGDVAPLQMTKLRTLARRVAVWHNLLPDRNSMMSDSILCTSLLFLTYFLRTIVD